MIIIPNLEHFDTLLTVLKVTFLDYNSETDISCISNKRHTLTIYNVNFRITYTNGSQVIGFFFVLKTFL